MLIQSVCGVKNAKPFDFFPQHSKETKPKSRRATAAEVRQNMKAYMEGLKAMEAQKK